MEHVIELMEDTSPDHFVMARDCIVHRATNDTIKWKNNTKRDYTIHFGEGCPVQENDFVVPAQGEKKPVGLTSGVAPGTYAYDILRKAAEIAADPNVIVR